MLSKKEGCMCAVILVVAIVALVLCIKYAGLFLDCIQLL